MRAVCLVALAAACSDRPSTQATPKTGSVASAGRVLRYQPVRVARFRLDVRVASPPGAVVPVDITRSVEIEVTTDDRAARARLAPQDPLAAYELGDAADAAVVLFPELPAQPVAPGTRWTVARAVAIAGTRIDVAHDVTYVGDSTCPSGGATCALLAIAAPSRNVVVRAGSAAWIATYRLDGTVHLDHARGIVDAGRLHASGNVANGPLNATVEATISAVPVGARD